MGVYVRLSTHPDRIHPDAWRRVYQESLQVLKAYPDVALNAVWRELYGEKVPMYARDLADVSSLGPGWRVCGDARSRLRAESFEFPENYGRAQSEGASDADLLIEAAHEGYVIGARIFAEKAEGRPYHVLVLAVATLVENRFPGAALAHGDITIQEGQEACDLLFRALGERMLPPVVLDPARMRARLLPSLGAEATHEAVKLLYPLQESPLISDLLEILQQRPQFRLPEELEHAVTCTDVTKLSATTLKVIAGAARSLADLTRQLEQIDEDPTRAGVADREALLRSIAIRTRDNSFIFTEDAWGEIQSEPLEALRFLYTVASARTETCNLRDLSRAWFESQALRRFGITQWRAAMSS